MLRHQFLEKESSRVDSKGIFIICLAFLLFVPGSVSDPH
jgi:hypothetical protein